MKIIERIFIKIFLICRKLTMITKMAVTIELQHQEL